MRRRPTRRSSIPRCRRAYGHARGATEARDQASRRRVWLGGDEAALGAQQLADRSQMLESWRAAREGASQSDPAATASASGTARVRPRSDTSVRRQSPRSTGIAQVSVAASRPASCSRSCLSTARGIFTPPVARAVWSGMVTLTSTLVAKRSVTSRNSDTSSCSDRQRQRHAARSLLERGFLFRSSDSQGAWVSAAPPCLSERGRWVEARDGV